jgi:shikimate kinase/3-dehydroquinate synthase
MVATPPPRALSLVGQMGAGKSTVARAFAEALLARGVLAEAVDLDAVIEARAGCTVGELFARDGEPAFRALERDLLRELIASPRAGLLVLATGGGAPCSDESSALLAAAGPVVWLDAPPSVLARRAATPDRPLLAGRTEAEAEAFLAAQRAVREPFYARAALRLEASSPVVALVAALVARYETTLMQPPASPPPLEVSLPAPDTSEVGRADYRVRFLAEPPGPAVADAVTRLLPRASRVLVVTDGNVARLHLSPVLEALRALPQLARVEACVVPPGETSKSLGAVGGVVDAALAAGLARHDALIALGGGVVGDLTGFAASMLHRGVPFVQVPTTLLAQVDSSVGGKTGVNHAAGKNLLGAFWQPVEVIASQGVLATLPPREVRCGLAEALKHGLIADAALVDAIAADSARLLALDPSAVTPLVARCCAIKAEVVARDPRDTGDRALLNFGHTLGHAYENLLGYGVLTHGEAVALGMLHAALASERLARREGREVALHAPIRALLDALGFETNLGAPGWPPLEALLQAARLDKKADAAGSVRFVVLDAIGAARIVRLGWHELAALVAPEAA